PFVAEFETLVAEFARIPRLARRNSGEFRYVVGILILASVPLVAVLHRSAGTAIAQENKAGATPLTELKVVERVTQATDKALDYLESKQSKTGEGAGSWSTNMAINAVAMLAYLSNGHVPGRGRYGDTIESGVIKPGVLTRAKKYVLSRANPQTGY